MIKFEFTLDDIDASNLVAILQEERARIIQKGLEQQRRVDERDGRHPTAEANARWYRAHATYLEALIEKVVKGNKRVN